ncbi:NAD(P)-binding protein [Cytidiella melzeri]|nr:NAD(P)-binding protein [Cytidiella melzeri]
MSAAVQQTFPPKPKWGVNDIPDQTGKVIIVTGGNAGIGKETVRVLLTKNAKVYIATRNKEKSLAVIEDLKKQTGKEALFLQLDLSDLKSVKAFAEEFLRKERKLHVLYNNTGVMYCPVDQLTAQGFDMTFGTNVIGHWYLTEHLMPALLAVPETEPGEKARIITLSSFAIYLGNIKWDSIEDTPQRRKSSPADLYSRISNEVARRYGDSGIVAISVNPGNIVSDLQRHLVGFQRWLILTLSYPVEFGALTQLYAGTDPHALELNGKFLIPWARVGTPPTESLDPAVGKKLWDWLEDHTKDV